MFREWKVREAITQFNTERLIFSIRQASAAKKLQPPEPPEILKGRIRAS